MDQQAWIDWLHAETAVPFAGWDFSYVTRTGRMKEAPLPWNYANLVSRRLRGAESLLDMGTGGGELLSLLRPLPPRTFATEGYAPNVPVARARLEPLVVTVVEADGEADLPFADEVFELVINRHESYRPEEVCRIMKPGACFITQQVGGHPIGSGGPHGGGAEGSILLYTVLRRGGDRVLPAGDPLAGARLFRGALRGRFAADSPGHRAGRIRGHPRAPVSAGRGEVTTSSCGR
jgi:hypothetical protein